MMTQPRYASQYFLFICSLAFSFFITLSSGCSLYKSSDYDRIENDHPTPSQNTGYGNLNKDQNQKTTEETKIDLNELTKTSCYEQSAYTEISATKKWIAQLNENENLFRYQDHDYSYFESEISTTEVQQNSPVNVTQFCQFQVNQQQEGTYAN